MLASKTWCNLPVTAAISARGLPSSAPVCHTKMGLKCLIVYYIRILNDMKAWQVQQHYWEMVSVSLFRFILIFLSPILPFYFLLLFCLYVLMSWLLPFSLFPFFNLLFSSLFVLTMSSFSSLCIVPLFWPLLPLSCFFLKKLFASHSIYSYCSFVLFPLLLALSFSPSLTTNSSCRTWGITFWRWSSTSVHRWFWRTSPFWKEVG